MKTSFQFYVDGRIDIIDNNWVNPMATGDPGIVSLSIGNLAPSPIDQCCLSACTYGEQAYHAGFKKE